MMKYVTVFQYFFAFILFRLCKGSTNSIVAYQLIIFALIKPTRTEFYQTLKIINYSQRNPLFLVGIYYTMLYFSVLT